MKKLLTCANPIKKWSDIKVGEVFAANDCWTILGKVGRHEAIIIDCDTHYSDNTRCFNEHFGKRIKVVEKVTQDWTTGKDLCYLNFETEYKIFMQPGIEDIYKLPKSVQRLWRKLK